MDKIRSNVYAVHTQFGTNEKVHNTLLQKLDNKQLEGSGFQFQETEEVVIRNI